MQLLQARYNDFLMSGGVRSQGKALCYLGQHWLFNSMQLVISIQSICFVDMKKRATDSEICCCSWRVLCCVWSVPNTNHTPPWTTLLGVAVIGRHLSWPFFHIPALHLCRTCLSDKAAPFQQIQCYYLFWSVKINIAKKILYALFQTIQWLEICQLLCMKNLW